VYAAEGGARLGYLHYHRPNARASTALVYLHGIESHSGWFDIAADLLVGKGYEVFALDRRGSGVNRENRGFPSGHVDSISTLVADVGSFVRPLRDTYDSVFLVGLSWGGKLALAFGLRHPEDVDGLILITPGVRSLVDVGIADKLAVFFTAWSAPTTAIKLPIEAEMFTTTPRFLEYIRQDPLRLRYASSRFLMESNRVEKEIDRRMPENTLPILLILAGQERIIDNRGVLRVVQAGPPDLLDVVEYDDQTHSVQFDAPERLADDMAGWIERRIAEGRPESR
jgi:alpha-beta hydrolase superfamily lysophospholipase